MDFLAGGLLLAPEQATGVGQTIEILDISTVGRESSTLVPWAYAGGQLGEIALNPIQSTQLRQFGRVGRLSDLVREDPPERRPGEIEVGITSASQAEAREKLTSTGDVDVLEASTRYLREDRLETLVREHDTQARIHGVVDREGAAEHVDKALERRLVNARQLMIEPAAFERGLNLFLPRGARREIRQLSHAPSSRRSGKDAPSHRLHGWSMADPARLRL